MQMEAMELQHVVFETDEGRVDAMWSDVRLHANDVPDGWHCYAVRGGDGGWPPVASRRAYGSTTRATSSCPTTGSTGQASKTKTSSPFPAK